MDGADCFPCRKESEISNEGMEGLPTNSLIANSLPMNDGENLTTEATKYCDGCVGDSAVAIDRKCEMKPVCIDRQESRCESASELRHSKTAASRCQRSVSEGGNESDHLQSTCYPKLCGKHPSKEMEIYCLKCNNALCLTCFETLHYGHKSAAVSKVANDFRNKIGSSMTDLGTSIDTIDETLRKMRDTRQVIVERFGEVELKLRARADELKATIERHTQQLLTELNELKTESLKDVETCEMELTQDRSSIESFVKKGEELLTQGSNIDIARETRCLLQKSTELKQLCASRGHEKVMLRSSVTFKPSETTFTDAINVVGIIIDKELSPALKYSLAGNKGFCAVCWFKGQLFVTRDSTKQVEVYDASTLKLQRKISLPDAAGDWLFGVVACSTSNALYVSDYQEDRVYKVNLSASDTTSSWSVDIGGPVALSLNRSHNLLLAFWDGKKIREYTPCGSLLREIFECNHLYHAVELNNGTIMMSRAGPIHGVCVASVNGKVIRSYGSRKFGSGPGQMDEPRSLAVDSEGFVLVADKDNNRILVLNPELTESRVLPLTSLDTPLTSPRSLFFDESRGRLYVGEYAGKTRLLVFENVFNLSSLFSRQIC